MSLNCRTNFPSIGHYNTWIVDQLKILIEYNHNVYLFPNYSNYLDYADNNESFRTIALNAETLKYLLDNRNINDDKVKLTREQKYIAKAIWIKYLSYQFTQNKNKNYLANCILKTK